MKMDEADPLFQAELMMESDDATIVVFDGAVAQFGTLVTLDSVRNILLVSGGYASREESGAFRTLMEALDHVHDMNFPCFQNVPPEPDAAEVEKIVAEMEIVRPDMVIALGGGSVMDAAKAAYLSWQSGIPVRELFGVNVASTRFPDRKFKRISCFPTTSGTGSEVTQYANIIDPVSGVKKLIVEQEIIPEYAFVNPEFTLTLPEKITRNTAFDALCHAIESLLNFKAAEQHPEAAQWSVQAAKLIVKALPVALNKPRSFRHRRMLASAATLGGMAIRLCPTSLPHLASFSVCGKASHGAAVAAFLPHFWRAYLVSPEVCSKTMLLKDIFPGETPEEVVSSCEKFIIANGGCITPEKVFNVGTEFIEKISSDASGNPVKLLGCPVPLTVESCPEFFRKALKNSWNR